MVTAFHLRHGGRVGNPAMRSRGLAEWHKASSLDEMKGAVSLETKRDPGTLSAHITSGRSIADQVIGPTRLLSAFVVPMRRFNYCGDSVDRLRRDDKHRYLR